MKKLQKGFTLIELLVVIAIIGILASIVLASLDSARKKGRDARRIADLKQLQLALELYYDANNGYPSSTTAAALVTPGYISVIPTDPSNGAAYSYAGIGTGTTCSSYHLGATLETAGHSAFSADADASAAGSVCTGSVADFSAVEPTNTKCNAADSGSAGCYDLKP